MRPRLAIVPGDPSGIGPELIAKLLAEDGVCDAADILLVGDAHIWQRGADQAGCEIELNTLPEAAVVSFKGLVHLDMETIDASNVEIAEFTVAGGRTSLHGALPGLHGLSF